LDAEPLRAGALDIVNLGGKTPRKTLAGIDASNHQKDRDYGIADCRFSIAN
jgi:hypothetical protein